MKRDVCYRDRNGSPAGGGVTLTVKKHRSVSTSMVAQDGAEKCGQIRKGKESELEIGYGFECNRGHLSGPV